ncbi:MAG TPA: hypothetical protein VEZ19_14715 [Rubrobacter sp.]|nr:hypothetical protein [Rubrobacter sp.]
MEGRTSSGLLPTAVWREGTIHSVTRSVLIWSGGYGSPLYF